MTGSGVTPAGDRAPRARRHARAGARGWARVRALDAAGRAGGWSIGVPLPLPAGVPGPPPAPRTPRPPTCSRCTASCCAWPRCAATRWRSSSVPARLAATREARPRRRAAGRASASRSRTCSASARSRTRGRACRRPHPRSCAPCRPTPCSPGSSPRWPPPAARGSRSSDRPLRDAVDTTGDRASARAAARLRQPLRHRRPAGSAPTAQDTLALDADAGRSTCAGCSRSCAARRCERGRADASSSPTARRSGARSHRDLDGLLGAAARARRVPARARDRRLPRRRVRRRRAAATTGGCVVRAARRAVACRCASSPSAWSATATAPDRGAS